ncbi:hypothetical protein TNCV_3379991, partial [Trichonephila clavipes]
MSSETSSTTRLTSSGLLMVRF